ncbi:MAG: hypothetical protein M3Z24_09355, partial [Chloroflexota bacterium]|nr:hypothetical protein [Chloroflexota bacterium]
MSSMIAKQTAMRQKSRLQAYLLLIEGVLCLITAWILQLNPYTYPIGVLLLGIGLFLATMVNAYRLTIATWLIFPLGIAVFLAFKNLIPGSQVLSAFILAIGIGILGIAYMTRLGYVGRGALSPGIIIIVVGILEYLLAAHLT